MFGRPVRLGRPRALSGLPEGGAEPRFRRRHRPLAAMGAWRRQAFGPRRAALSRHRHRLSGKGQRVDTGQFLAGLNRTKRTMIEKRKAAMTINLKVPDLTELKPRITVFGVGGAGGNAVNNMIACRLAGRRVRRRQHRRAGAVAARAPSAASSWAPHVTEGLGAGAKPEIGARRGRGGDGRHQGASRRLPHGVHHRRHGRRHRHRRGARDRPRRRARKASSPSAW